MFKFQINGSVTLRRKENFWIIKNLRYYIPCVYLYIQLDKDTFSMYKDTSHIIRLLTKYPIQIPDPPPEGSDTLFELHSTQDKICKVTVKVFSRKHVMLLTVLFKVPEQQKPMFYLLVSLEMATLYGASLKVPQNPGLHLSFVRDSSIWHQTSYVFVASQQGFVAKCLRKKLM